ncbi:aminotransferase class V-fold PLP-dependent enzyme [Geoglobus acetivorans]|uniref:Aspartate aminotransferase family protein n=1 Tax=Geoglobus acetivorans TaxID=565033 RepID=A0ABZ3H263_GEOAI|nr:aspartate aminotransferase family protein [Geoglobus acetivorans]
MKEIEDLLSELDGVDIDPHSGKLFAYIYETGDERLRELALEVLKRFYNKNILDFTVFRSAIFFEREVISFCKTLLNADENAVGTFTYGGTESIMLAVLSARNYFRKRNGGGTPEMVVPFTIHPSFIKSAHYFGLKVRMVDIDENCKADVDAVNSAVNENTALIALSAPNWPYGTVDPVEAVAEIAEDNNVLLHVDACLGGFILPFFEKLGEKVEKFDFRVDGVTSISIDAHKYGYTPKGASSVIFRNTELKKHAIFVDTANPGYVFVNPAVLSSRSVGPLASAFAVMRYLGKDGYLNLARKILSARDKIYRGMRDLGFESVGPIESQVLSLYNESVDILGFMEGMRKRGWHFHLQKGVEKYGIKPNIHLTVSPVHDETAEDFVRDAGDAVNERSSINAEELFKKIAEGKLQELLNEFREGKIDSSMAPLLLEQLDEEIANEIVKELVVGWYR